MNRKIPKGLLILSLYFIVTSIYSVRYFFQPIDYAIFFNVVLKGVLFQVNNGFFIIAGLIIGVGLYLRRKWGFVIFIAHQVLVIGLLFFNILLINESTLLEAGWRSYNNIEIVLLFKSFTIVSIALQLLLIIWANRYRNLFDIKTI